MDELENRVTETLMDMLTPDWLILQLIESRLQDQGIELDDDQRRSLRHQLEQAEGDQVSFELDRQRLRAVSDAETEHLTVDLSQANDVDEEIEKGIAKALNEESQRFANAFLETWESDGPALLQEQNHRRVEFVAELERVWKAGLDLLETLQSTCLAAGATFNNHYRPNAAEVGDFVFDAITRLHARGCQVGWEILLLLRNGFADGAHARWRTLHEISVEALFIARHDRHVAKRYFDHQAVGEYRRANQHRQHHKALGYAPPDPKVLEQVEAEFKRVVGLYGDGFKHDYGWAAEAMQQKRPHFADIERAVGLSFMRAFYKLANINVHSGSSGASFRLGAPPSDPEMLVAGPSVFGIGEPAQNSAYTLSLLTSTLLSLRPNFDSVVYITAIHELRNRTIWTFDELMEGQEQDM